MAKTILVQSSRELPAPDYPASPKYGRRIEAIKELYRRPTTIPFPKDNLYTPEKAALGKKLYFDVKAGAIIPH